MDTSGLPVSGPSTSEPPPLVIGGEFVSPGGSGDESFSEES